MVTFDQWLENRIRTGLGIKPLSYVVGQYPPAYFMPYSSTALVSLKTNHKDWLKNFDKKKHKKKQSD